MMLEENYRLANGVTIPKLGLGTWQISNEEVTAVVRSALAHGYRHIDTAIAYDNEEGIGKALAESAIPREELFITTKIPAEVKTYEEAKTSIDDSLARLGLDYLDLMLIHSPKPWKDLFAGTEKTYFEENLAVWQAMTEAVEAGKVRAIGVSNFSIADIQNLLDHAPLAPQVNQIRVHVGHTPQEVITYCQERGILVEAYSPNATGHLLDNPVVVEMAEKYGVSVPQLCIRYDLQLGLLPLPKTRHEAYLIQNAQVDFVISDQDMDILKAVPEVDSLG